MCRFLEAGRSVWRRPLLWVPLLLWAALTPLVRELMPAGPTLRFDLNAANLAQIPQDPEKNDSDRRVFAISPNGDKVVTSNYLTHDFLSTIGGLDALDDDARAKVEASRLFNVIDGEMNELTSVAPDTYFSDNRWRAVSKSDPRPLETRTHFIHRDTGTKSPDFVGVHAQSPRGGLVAYSDGNANHLLDLEKGQTRHFFVKPTVETSTLVPFTPVCFSDDEQLLAGTKDEFVVVVDVKTGAIRASLPYRPHDSAATIFGIKFAPDGQAIAWLDDHNLVVTDLGDQKQCVIPKAMFVVWLSPGLVLTAPRENGHGPLIRRLDSWNWREGRAVATWTPPVHYVIGRMTSWASRPEIFVAQSPDRRHVLFAGYAYSSGPSPWVEKIRRWFDRPTPHDLQLETFILDGDTLEVRDRLQIPAEHAGRGMFQFTADGRHVVFTDDHVVEHWPIPSRPWLKGALWAGGGTIGLVGLVAAWRWWRGRKKKTVAAPGQ